jgi:hypothetical protein
LACQYLRIRPYGTFFPLEEYDLGCQIKSFFPLEEYDLGCQIKSHNLNSKIQMKDYVINQIISVQWEDTQRIYSTETLPVGRLSY